jgi:hypothetical protein
MDQEKEKIPSPFQAPDGYFDGFEARLEARMSPSKGGSHLKVQHNKIQELTSPTRKDRPIAEWLAVAATVAVIVVSGYMFYQKLGTSEPETIPVAKQDKPNRTVEVPKVEEKPSPEVVEDMVVTVMLEEAEQVRVATVNQEKALTRKEATAAEELEDAGLIVLETNDGLFDQFEL